MLISKRVHYTLPFVIHYRQFEPSFDMPSSIAYFKWISSFFSLQVDKTSKSFIFHMSILIRMPSGCNIFTNFSRFHFNKNCIHDNHFVNVLKRDKWDHVDKCRYWILKYWRLLCTPFLLGTPIFVTLSLKHRSHFPRISTHHRHALARLLFDWLTIVHKTTFARND